MTGGQCGFINGSFFPRTVPGMQDFNYLHTNCFEVTVEVGCERFPPQEELHLAWQENYQALITFMEAVGSCSSLESVFRVFFHGASFFLTCIWSFHSGASRHQRHCDGWRGKRNQRSPCVCQRNTTQHHHRWQRQFSLDCVWLISLAHRVGRTLRDEKKKSGRRNHFICLVWFVLKLVWLFSQN